MNLFHEAILALGSTNIKPTGSPQCIYRMAKYIYFDNYKPLSSRRTACRSCIGTTPSANKTTVLLLREERKPTVLLLREERLPVNLNSPTTISIPCCLLSIQCFWVASNTCSSSFLAPSQLFLSNPLSINDVALPCAQNRRGPLV